MGMIILIIPLLNIAEAIGVHYARPDSVRHKIRKLPLLFPIHVCAHCTSMVIKYQ